MMDKVREEFEKWQIETGRTDPMWLGDGWFHEGENIYALNKITSDWEIWQAAHATGYRAGFRAASGEVEQ